MAEGRKSRIRRFLGYAIAASAVLILGGGLYAGFLADKDACLVIAYDLAEAKAARPQGEVPQEEIESTAARLNHASVISIGRGRIRAEVRGTKLTCWTKGIAFGLGAVSSTVDLRSP